MNKAFSPLLVRTPLHPFSASFLGNCESNLAHLRSGWVLTTSFLDIENNNPFVGYFRGPHKISLQEVRLHSDDTINRWLTYIQLVVYKSYPVRIWSSFASQYVDLHEFGQVRSDEGARFQKISHSDRHYDADPLKSQRHSMDQLATR